MFSLKVKKVLIICITIILKEKKKLLITCYYVLSYNNFCIFNIRLPIIAGKKHKLSQIQVKGLQNARGLQNASLNKGASTFHGNAKILII